MICAAILARNSAGTIPYAIRSVSWCDAIFLFDDHSSDGTAETATGSIPIHIEQSPFRRLAFAEGELRVRNHMLECHEHVRAEGLDQCAEGGRLEGRWGAGQTRTELSEIQGENHAKTR